MTSQVQAEILAATVTPPPEALRERGLTHWSARRLADWLAQHRGIRISHDSIAVLWRKFCLQPHRSEGFKFSIDPALEAKTATWSGCIWILPRARSWSASMRSPRSRH